MRGKGGGQKKDVGEMRHFCEEGGFFASFADLVVSGFPFLSEMSFENERPLVFLPFDSGLV